MPPKSKLAAKPSPYPYKIPPIEYLKHEELKDPSSKDTLEFLRIEALLRTKHLTDLYKDTFGPNATASITA